MKNVKVALAIVSVAALAACSSPAPRQQLTQAPAAVNVARYNNPELNEAANAYVSLYKESIEKSLSERKYKTDLAHRHLSAEACLESRASRLSGKPLTQQEKNDLVLSIVPRDQFQQYQSLAKGHFSRINGFEFLTCEVAGLKVDSKNMRY